LDIPIFLKLWKSLDIFICSFIHWKLESSYPFEVDEKIIAPQPMLS
jgi:hypothetical protein